MCWAHLFAYCVCVRVCLCMFRLLELELSLADERARRESAEESLRLAEDRAKRWRPDSLTYLCHSIESTLQNVLQCFSCVASSLSRDAQRDFSIEMETEEEWEALSLNPNQPLITRKVRRCSFINSVWLNHAHGVWLFPVCTSRWKAGWWRAGAGSEAGAFTSPGCWRAVLALDTSFWPTCSQYTCLSSCASLVPCSKVTLGNNTKRRKGSYLKQKSVCF